MSPRRAARFGLCLASLVALPLFGCHDPRSSPRLHPMVKSAEFGVFVGDQLSRRTQIPFELLPTRQTQGFRLTFTHPLPNSMTVRLALDAPAAPNGPRGATSSRRTERTAEWQVPKGALTFERPFEFAPTDHTGLYNIRVYLEKTPVLDQPFLVVPPSRTPARER